MRNLGMNLLIAAMHLLACGTSTAPSINTDLNLGTADSQDGSPVAADAERQTDVERPDGVSGDSCSVDDSCDPSPCLTSLDCPGDLVCHVDSESCVDCVTQTDCPEESECGPDFTCHPLGGPCQSDKDCKDFGLLCNKDTGLCVECLNSAACAEASYCSGSYCVPDVCEAGAKDCLNNIARTCNEEGSSWNEEECLGTQYCLHGDCFQLLCPPDASWCEEDVYHLCSPDGKSLIAKQDCGLQEQFCTLAGCEDTLCESGQIWCVDGGTKAVCGESGMEFTETSCSEGEFCLAGICIPWVCAPGTLSCDENSVVQCDEWGSQTQFVKDCGADVCVAGMCQPDALPECGDGECQLDEDCESCAVDCGECPSCQGCTALEMCSSLVQGCVSAMAGVPEGDFWMGCRPEQFVQCAPPLLPYHSVHLKSYLIGKTEVTASQFEACVAAQVCEEPQDSDCASGTTTYGKEGFEKYPVNCVDYDDAVTYCNWIGMRLCTEAEWEKAGRGGCELWGDDCWANSPAYPWGDAGPTCETAAFDGCPPDLKKISEVGSRPLGQSPYGVFDLSGNVWELVADWYSSNFYCAGPDADVDNDGGWDYCGEDSEPHDMASIDPVGPPSGNKTVARGGYWKSPASSITVSWRQTAGPGLNQSEFAGFRCCVDP